MLKKRFLPFAATLLLLLAVMLGVAQSTAATSNAASSYRPPSHTGGTITYGLSLFPSSTNPWFNTATEGIEVQDALWGKPVTVSNDGAYIPDQLVEVPTVQNGDVSPDGLTVVMKLRPDLTWSDGQPITADDFVYWQQTNLDPATGSADVVGTNQIISIVAQDAHTVVLAYAHPYAPYLDGLPFAAPRHAWGSIPDNMLSGDQDVNLTPQVDSGPFMISSFVAGDSFTLVPNPHYTSSTFHRSVLDQLVFKAYSSIAALIAAYQAGQVQHADGFGPVNLTQLDGLPGLHLADDIAFEFLTFNLANPVLQDLNIRQAIAQAIDRCQLIQQAIQEPCNALSVRGLLPRPSPAFDPAVHFPDFNLKQAREAMQAAGWDCSSNPCMKNNQPFPTLTLVTTINNAVRAASSQFIQQALAALGIPVTLQFYPAGTLFGTILPAGQFDLATYAIVFNFDPDNLSTISESDQVPPNSVNFGRISDPNLDALFAQGRTTLDQPQRVKIYQQAQELIANQVYLLPLYLFSDITLTSSQVINYADDIGVVGNAWNLGDWWLKAEP